MASNEFGKIVRDEWFKSAEIRPEIVLDEFVVMPNHFHGIIVIVGENRLVGATRQVAPTGPQPGSIGAIIGQFKSAVTKQINKHRHSPGEHVWQRNYYDHIIRDKDELNRIRQYIADNPKNRKSDENYWE